ncbi:MAG: hypothetical protein R2754_00840 [Microthrixaceae bacterium]
MSVNEVELPALPKATAIFLVGSNAAFLTVAVLEAGPWVLLLWMAALVLNGIFVVLGRRRLAQPFSARATPTGTLVMPPPPVDPTTTSFAPSRRTWSGAALVPTALGGKNASIPLAALSINEDGVEVRIRPSLLGLAFGYRPTTLGPGDFELIVPVTRRGVREVALLPRGRPAIYFFNSDVSRILSALDNAGFPVDWSEHRVRSWGRAP